jgi:transposase
VLSCVDNALRRLGGAPTYLLTDNERTLTTDRVARVPIRHPALVAAGRHYGIQVETCVPCASGAALKADSGGCGGLIAPGRRP